MSKNSQGHGSEPTIRPKLKKALEAMVDEGKDVAQAAEVAGMNAAYLRRALKKPHVVDAVRRMVDARLSSTSLVQACNRLHTLIDANSEYVQFKAVKHILDIGGISPASDVRNPFGKGLTININLSPPEEAERSVVDVTPGENLEPSVGA